ncbi:N-acetylmuramoyl-L-alanine amidase [Pseudogemmobacter sonorensis]|uniref:N-acetylmuramoyl-L-alanine amidase n=1 Tax=Pseudogemmobacter sonorensis TaxID=2989681 RepID=UPI0036CAAFC7
MSFPSPNFGARRGGVRPSLVVLHYTAMASCAAARARLCDAQAEVSAHWLISETGEAEALVPEEARAWHAGAGHWRGLTDVNSHSIGIELANRGDHPFPEPQMRALEDLLRGVMRRWSIPRHGVIAHSDIAPLRKSDPGARFDWRRLALGGLSIWPEIGEPRTVGAPRLVDPARFRALATLVGYDPDLPEEALLRAFRLRFRPWAEGPCSAADLGRMAEVARLSVDGAGAGA